MVNVYCTLGPASLTAERVKAMSGHGVDAFRLNMSHVGLDELERHISLIRSVSTVPIFIDSEGSQIRTSLLPGDSICVSIGDEVTFVGELDPPVAGCSRHVIPLTPASVIDEMAAGDLLSVDFDGVMVQINDIKGVGEVRGRCIAGGEIKSNKAVTVDRAISMPDITAKDEAACEIGRRLGVTHYALSFARNKSAVKSFRELLPQGSFVVSKIECVDGLKNLEEIALASDAILIDRGDLSREIPLVLIPDAQKQIIERCKKLGVPVFVATNLLESMCQHKYPTRAEVHDIMRILELGAEGLVLAAETAIGQHPVTAVGTIRSIVKHFMVPEYSVEQTENGLDIESKPRRCFDGAVSKTVSEIKIQLDARAKSDLLQILEGVYSPISGFMSEPELWSVLDRQKLLSNEPWTMPILLPVDPTTADRLEKGMKVGLYDRSSGEELANILVDSCYQVAPEYICQKIWDSFDENHPGAAQILVRGSHFIGGAVSGVGDQRSKMSTIHMSPNQLRLCYQALGWQRVVGFHTRNIPHMGHELLHKMALEDADADGILITPVVGQKKVGDFSASAILAAYSAYIQNRKFMTDRAILSTFETYSRFAGVREAIFTALCRKNMGCTHFIIGRDHAGLGMQNDYEDYKSKFESYGDIGIELLIYDEILWDATNGKCLFRPKPSNSNLRPISGTEVRAAINAGDRARVPFIQEDVYQSVISLSKQGVSIFEENEID